MLMWTIGLSAHADETQSNDLNNPKTTAVQAQHTTWILFPWDDALTGLLVQAFQFYIAF